MARIDAHQHFWTTSRDDYGWLTSDLGPIYRDFLPHDLAPLIERANIDKTILVQAAQSEAETLFLLDIAAKTDFVAGVVGWVDLEAANAADRVADMAKSGVIGLRPMVQDIEDTQWLLHPALRAGIEAMIAHDLRFDALIQPRHLSVVRQFALQYSDLKIIIDHGAKPEIAAGSIEPWASDMSVLARDTNVYCKLSGLVTEAGTDWAASDIAPFAEILIDAFGPQRLVWGSDWPVLNLASDYATWEAISAAFLAKLTPQEIARVMGENAEQFYGLGQ